MIELTPETEALARRLAEADGQSIDATVRRALEARAVSARPRAPAVEPPRELIAARREAIDDIVAKIATLPVLDPRSPKEIMDDLDSL